MSKVLDLSAFVEDSLEIKMPDGTVLNIAKPTQKMVIMLIALRDKAENTSNYPEMLKAMNKVVTCILNNNDAGKLFTEADVDTMNIKMKTAIIQAYSEYIAGIQSDPNS